MAYMTDTGRIGAIVNYWFAAGSAPPAFTIPFFLRLMTTVAGGNGNVSGTNGTEATSGNCPGYTALGNSMGASGATFSTFSPTSPAAVVSNNAVSWTATGTWTTIVAIEIWDSSATKLRYLQGTISNITGVINGDTVQFAAGAITVNPTQW